MNLSEMILNEAFEKSVTVQEGINIYNANVLIESFSTFKVLNEVNFENITKLEKEITIISNESINALLEFELEVEKQNTLALALSNKILTEAATQEEAESKQEDVGKAWNSGVKSSLEKLKKTVETFSRVNLARITNLIDSYSKVASENYTENKDNKTTINYNYTLFDSKASKLSKSASTESYRGTIDDIIKTMKPVEIIGNQRNIALAKNVISGLKSHKSSLVSLQAEIIKDINSALGKSSNEEMAKLKDIITNKIYLLNKKEQILKDEARDYIDFLKSLKSSSK